MLLAAFFVSYGEAAHGDDTPRIMQMAIASGDLKLLEQCVAAGVPVNGFADALWPVKEERQWGSVALAVAWQQPRVVAWLLAHKADATTEIGHELTAWDLATEMKQPHLVKFLPAPAPRRKPKTGLLATAPPQPDIHDRHAFLWPDLDLLPSELSPAHVRLLLDRGLDPLRMTGEPPLEENAFLKIAGLGKPELLQALFDARPALKKEKTLWRKAVEQACRTPYAKPEIAAMLALPPDQRQVVGVHVAALEVQLEMLSDNPHLPHTFITFNEEDPPEDILKLIRRRVPRACVQSHSVERPNKQTAWVHRKTGKPGDLIELKLLSRDGVYDYSVRWASGPVMAGGGTRGVLALRHGHWIIIGAQGWDE